MELHSTQNKASYLQKIRSETFKWLQLQSLLLQGRHTNDRIKWMDKINHLGPKIKFWIANIKY